MLKSTNAKLIDQNRQGSGPLKTYRLLRMQCRERMELKKIIICEKLNKYAKVDELADRQVPNHQIGNIVYVHLSFSWNWVSNGCLLFPHRRLT